MEGRPQPRQAPMEGLMSPSLAGQDAWERDVYGRQIANLRLLYECIIRNNISTGIVL